MNLAERGGNESSEEAGGRRQLQGIAGPKGIKREEINIVKFVKGVLIIFSAIPISCARQCAGCCIHS